MKHYLLPIFTLVLLATTFSCEKEEPNDPEPSEPTMPPLTHQGLNTFGCYIDGELFVASEGESVWSIPPVSGSFNESSRELRLQGTRYRYGILPEGDAADYMTIIADITGEGVHEYKIFDENLVGYSNPYVEGNCEYYYKDIPDLGKLSITFLDEEQNIITGTFNMNLINEYCESDSIIEITDGRFDFRY